MRRRGSSPLIGKWRIIEMALWDRDYLDMIEPAYIQFQRNGLGEFKFGCVVGGLDCTLYTRQISRGSWDQSASIETTSANPCSSAHAKAAR